MAKDNDYGRGLRDGKTAATLEGGAADQGLEDDEVLHYVINEPPRRRFGRK